MGKKVDKAAAKDKGQASASSQDHEEDMNKPPEPYVCVGHFAADFSELCKRSGLAYCMPVMNRPHRPSSPAVAPVEEVKAKPGKGGDKKGKGQVIEAPPEIEPEKEQDPNAENAEPPPKTYLIKDKFEYFKPCIQVEMENADKADTVTEVHIRGWRLDDQYLTILRDCWVKMDKLNTICLWNVGLTEQKIEYLAKTLPEVPNVRTLILDNNVVPEQNFHILLRDDSPLTNLSLRYNKISDTGALSIGRVLGTLNHQNQKLLTLNLNGNEVGDKGAVHLAEGLRMNRTLLSLNLANNNIGDEGAKALADVLSRFPLTHVEIVERRKMVFDRGQTDRKSDGADLASVPHHIDTAAGLTPPPNSRRADSRDRPGSVRSIQNIATAKGGKSAKAGKGKEPPKGKEKEEEKPAKGGKGAKEVPEPKTQKKTMADASKAKGKDKGTKGAKGKAAAQPEVEGRSDETPEVPETTSPLLDNIEKLDDGTVLLMGNRVIINLNLSMNNIGPAGIQALYVAVCYQATLAEFPPTTTNTGKNVVQPTGLMRLCVNKNKVPMDDENYQKLNAIMLKKDPFYKPPATPQSPDVTESSSRNRRD